VTRLRVVPPGEVPDDRAAVARALLGDGDSLVCDQAHAVMGWDRAASKRMDELTGDPRFLIGRLWQALTALVEADVPPPDATGRLLMEAIEDAITYRRHSCSSCRDEGCGQCSPDWRKAELYFGLYAQLGLIEDRPPRRPVLTAVDQ
jgi:hypothetical protein